MAKEKKYIYKIKDLPTDFNLIGCKLGKLIIYSGWNKGFWLKKDEQSSQIHPVFFKSFDDIRNWKVEVPPLRAIQIEKLTKKTK